MFPLAFDPAGQALVRGDVLNGGLLQAISHATAKAGMFMAAGLVYAGLGHDRIADLAGVARALPITVLTFLVAGVALMGVLPSGAYLAKKLLLAAADGSGQWWWTVVLQGGAVFTAAYVVLVMVNVMRRPVTQPLKLAPVSLWSQWAALSLATCSLLLGLAAQSPALPAGIVKNPLAWTEAVPTLLVLAGGALLALAVSRKALSARVVDTHPLRRALLPLGVAFERADAFVRRWTSASMLMILLVLMFGVLFARGPGT
jgi:NADH:ubiquinone oxidoreductase subunit 5 (subunit L)/multisubunit Na+/H+ antiporter MnhA subunit